MASVIPPAVAVDGVTLRDVAGVLSIAPLSQPVALQDFGSSSSGTPGTLIAEIAPALAQQIAAFAGWVGTPGASGPIDIVLTFTDDTTETLSISTVASTYAFNRSGVNRVDSPNNDFRAFVDQTKKVKKVTVQTADTGVGARTAFVAGVAIPLEVA